MKYDQPEQFLQRFDKNIKGKFSYLPSLIKSMTVRSEEHIRVIDSDLACDMFNIIFCDKTPSHSSVHSAINYFRYKKLPYAFWIGFEKEPPWLEKQLQDLGLITDEMEWAMVCNLKQHHPKIDINDFEIKKACDHAKILDVIKIMNTILPDHEHQAIKDFFIKASPILVTKNTPLIFFVGYENKEPVCISSIYFDEGLASIFDLIVIPQKRGKGLGKLMMQYSMHEAKEQGIDLCVLTAANEARYLYEKLGFEDIKTMKVYHEKP